MSEGSKGPCSLETTVQEVRDMALQHEQRLNNGLHRFESVKKSIDDIDKRTTQKPPSVMKIIAITLTVFMTAATALWGLAQKLSDRPTTGQMKEILHTHEGNGHTTLRSSVQAVRSEQTAQRVIIDQAAMQGRSNSKKLDKLLIRLPDRPLRRR